jgi:hypothetical protein
MEVGAAVSKREEGFWQTGSRSKSAAGEESGQGGKRWPWSFVFRRESCASYRWWGEWANGQSLYLTMIRQIDALGKKYVPRALR